MKKIILKLFILTTCCVAVFTHTTSHTHAQTSGTFNLLSHFGGRTNAVFVDGNTAYIGRGGALAIMDISDPTNPIRIGKSEPLPDVIEDIEVVGSVAYIADGSDGLVTVDVSNPAAPTLLGSYDTAGIAYGVQVVGSVAYIADSFSGLVTVDVSDPAAPALIGSYDTVGEAWDVQVVGSVAYIADRSNGLVTVDVSNPAAPTLLGSYDTAGEAYDVVQVVGSVAYIADDENGLVAVDVSDPAVPTLLGSYDTVGFALSVQVVGSVAYIADYDNGLIMVDVGNPAAPALIGSYAIEYARGVQVVGSIAYIADGFNGLVMVNVSDPAAPALLGSVDTIGSARDVQIVGSVAYIADYLDGLVTVDVSDLAAPVLLGSYNIAGQASGVQVVGNVAYIADYTSGLVTVDVSNSAAPTPLGSYDTAGGSWDVQVVGGVAYIADGFNGLVMIDVSDPAAPTPLGSVDTAGEAWDVQVVGSVAYIADGENGLVTVDVSDPAVPALIGSVDIAGIASGVQIVGGVAYIADRFDGLVTVDVSDPAAPTLLSSVDTTGIASGVQVVGSVAYIADRFDGLVAVDVSDPAAPTLLRSVDTAGVAHSVQVVDDVLYVASGSGGLYALAYIPDGDNFEINDACTDVSAIETDGSVQTHTFHDQGDEDWVRFDVVEDGQYAVIGSVPAGSSADLVVEIYDSCGGSIEKGQGHTFAPGVRLDFSAPSSGTYYLKVENDDPSVFGDDVTYMLSVQERVVDMPRSAVIIVAGRQLEGDILQSNIHYVTNNVYRMYKEYGYEDYQIQYLANDLTLDPAGNDASPVDELATKANLQDAIVSWAGGRVDESQALTLYMMSHGDQEKFFLDGDEEFVTPAELNEWLTALEASVTGDLKINVIIDACHAGSFIDTETRIGTASATISAPGRVVITSSGRYELAWASPRGAIFSDMFTYLVRNNHTVLDAFRQAGGAAQYAPWPQTVWLDDNGNGIPNEPADGLEAAVRSLGFSGSFSTLPRWEPYISDVYPVTRQADTKAMITARVRDDKSEIAAVYAQLYPPSYPEPDVNETQLVAPSSRVVPLTVNEQGLYSGQFCPDELGEWTAVIYAEDGDELISRPETLSFNITDNISDRCRVPLAVGISEDTVGNIALKEISLVYVSVTVTMLCTVKAVRPKKQ